MTRYIFHLGLSLCIFIYSGTFGYSQTKTEDELFSAVKKNNLQEVTLLLKKNININATDSNGATLLMWAAYKASIDVVKLLHKNGANPRKKGVIYINDDKSAYYGNLVGIAAGEGNIFLLDYFISKCGISVEDKEYNPETKKEDGWSPLQWAAANGKVGTVNYLINKGAVLDKKSSVGKTALHYAVINSHKLAALSLISAGANINLKDSNGWTPLHWAARDDQPAIAAELIYNNVNINAVNNSGWTPLMLSCYNGNYDIAFLLLRYGADTNLINLEKTTAKALATNKDQTDIVLLFNEFDTTKYFKGIKSFKDSGEFEADLHNQYLTDKELIFKKGSGKISLVLPAGHTDIIKFAQYSPDGKMLLTVSWDETAKLWDANTGHLLKTLEGHTDNIIDGGFSPNGKLIYTCAVDNPTRIWNATTGDLLGALYEPGIVKSADKLVFTNDTKKIITANLATRGLLIRDAKTLIPIDFLPIKDALHINELYLSKDGKKMITFDPISNSVKAIDMLTGETLYTQNHVSYFTFFPKRELSIICTEDGSAIFLNIDFKSFFASIKGNNHKIKYAELSSDEKYFISITDDSILTIQKMNDLSSSIEIKKVTNAKMSFGGKVIISFADSKVKVFNFLLNRFVADFKNADFSGTPKIQINPDGEKALLYGMYSDMGRSGLWNINSGVLSSFFGGNSPLLTEILFDYEAKNILASYNNSTTKTWDLNTGSISKVSKVHYDSTSKRIVFCPEKIASGSGFAYNSDSSRVVVHSGKITDSIFRIYNINNCALIGAFKGGNISISPDGKKMIITPYLNGQSSNDDDPYAIDFTTGKHLFDLKGGDKDIKDATFSADGEKIITIAQGVWNGQLWNGNTGELIFSLGKHTYVVPWASFSPDGHKAITASSGLVKIWDTKSGNLIRNIELGYNTFIEDADFNTNRIVATYNNEIKLFDINTGAFLYSFYAIDSVDDICILPSKYYRATPNATRKLHYVTADLQIIPFEQLDIKYNRPDKVLEAIGSTDTTQINSYKKAYLKRIKKLGIDTSSFKEGFTIPEADFKNRNAVEYEQKNKQLKLQVAGNSTENLDRFNVWVNEVPLYSQKGISIRSKNRKTVDTTITVNLSEGDNQVETSITDVNGIESYRQPLFVKYIPEKSATTKTYFIGIGINKFADSTNNLNWSVKDIRDLANKFASKGAIIDTLFDERVTTQNILQLKNKLLQTGEEDKVVIAYSGHGLLSSDYDYFLSTYSVNFNQPQQNGLPYEELENLLDGIKARKKLLLIDACHSGEVDKEEMKNYTVAKDSLDKNGVKGLIITPTDKSKVGMKNSFELMQELFVNVGRGTGTTVISAASGTQFALERNNLKNGVFTYCLLQGMNTTNKVKISDLKKIVTEKVPELTNGLQKPTFRSETQQYDWELW